MLFLSKVTARYVVQILADFSSATGKIWRWVNDLDPALADPYFKGNGVLGDGTYFRPESYAPLATELKRATTWVSSEYDVDDTWDLPKSWELYSEYDASFKKVAHLNNENTDRLWDDDYIGKEGNPLKVGEFSSYDVGKLAKRKGFDAVLVTGEDVDGGNQLLVPTGSRPIIKPKSHAIKFKDKAHAKVLAEHLGVKAVGSIVKFEHSKAKAVSKVLKGFVPAQ